MSSKYDLCKYPVKWSQERADQTSNKRALKKDDPRHPTKGVLKGVTPRHPTKGVLKGVTPRHPTKGVLKGMAPRHPTKGVLKGVTPRHPTKGVLKGVTPRHPTKGVLKGEWSWVRGWVHENVTFGGQVSLREEGGVHCGLHCSCM